MWADKYQDYMYDLVKRVVDEIGPRPACSEAERKLGRMLCEGWRPICDRVETEPFTCRPGAFLGVIRVSVVLFFASIVLYWFYPFAAFVVAVLSLVALVFELVRYREFIDFIFLPEQGENIVGTIWPRGETKRRVIVSAHQDSAYEFRLWRLFGNAAVPIMILALLAYNLLRLCGQESLREDNGNLANRASHRKKAQRRRLRTVMQDLIYTASRISFHARRMHLSFGRYNPWSAVWQNLYRGFMVPVT